jgi:hypothetical protein
MSSIWYTRNSWYLRTGHAPVLSSPNVHFSHQYGECSAWAWCEPRSQRPALQLLLELVLAIDAHVAHRACRGTVVDRPAHRVPASGRHGDRHAAARPEHAHQLGDRAVVVPEVLEHLRRDDAVEARVGNGKAQRVAVDLAPGRVVGDLPALDHRAARRAPFLELAGVVVERDNRRAASHRRERVATTAAAHVEEPVPLAEVERSNFDGQHQASARRRAGAR